MHPVLLKWLMYWYPPYWATGIRLSRLSPDWRQAETAMPLRWYNRNYKGTHFGGSLYAMADPMLMIMLIQILGNEFRVWDKAARIEFIRPGRHRLTARFHVTDTDLETIRDATAHGEKHFHQFVVPITDPAGTRVAEVEKTIYVRRRAPKS